MGAVAAVGVGVQKQCSCLEEIVLFLSMPSATALFLVMVVFWLLSGVFTSTGHLTEISMCGLYC